MGLLQCTCPGLTQSEDQGTCKSGCCCLCVSFLIKAVVVKSKHAQYWSNSCGFSPAVLRYNLGHNSSIQFDKLDTI